MMQPLLPQRPIGLGDQVADELRRQIVTQVRPNGSLLLEEKLATDFQVSRGPVREAIRTLTQEGLVASGKRSATVIGLTAADIDELFSLRASLELLALRESVVQHSEDLNASLDAVIVDMKAAVAAVDAAAFTLADLHFHGAFYAASQHRRLSDVWAQYRPTIELLLLVANVGHADLEPALHSHIVLAELIRENELDAACDELEKHLDHSRARVRREYAGG
ncbi:GntR family transcriptional regulator [Salinibacterium sp. M195]|uniref:GntR family transcriptional regulator n=1 Tax=Salinibacterium sp. M195 TaxID=2583374 RepID=UPI001C637E76|nr:GntR family transcriptional regulator [Salinibacterium sp. M195]